MTDSTQLATSVASNFMMASFTKGAISNSRPDRSVADDIAMNNNVTEAGLVRVYKSLFSGHIGQLYREMTKAQYFCYTFYLDHSAPFNQSERHNRGSRLVPIGNAMQLTTDMAAHEATFLAAVEALAQAVDDPAERAQAVRSLGHLADLSLIPTGHEVRERCYVEFALEPVPSTTVWQNVNLPAEFTNNLIQQQATAVNKAMDKATGDITQRILNELDRIAKTSRDLLSYHSGSWSGQRAPKVYDSLRGNIEGLANLLRGTGEGLNRPELVTLADDIIESVTNYEPKELRNSPSLATHLSTHAVRLRQAVQPSAVPPAPRSSLDELIADEPEPVEVLNEVQVEELIEHGTINNEPVVPVKQEVTNDDLLGGFDPDDYSF